MINEWKFAWQDNDFPDLFNNILSSDEAVFMLTAFLIVIIVITGQIKLPMRQLKDCRVS